MGLYQGDLLLSKGGVDEAQINSKLEEFKNTLDINNMFIAIYNTTKSAEIEAAYSENKWIFVNYNGYLCPLTIRNSATKHSFISNAGAGVLQLTCLNNAWSVNTLNYADSIHGAAHAPDGSDPIPGQIKIIHSSYTGTNTYGESNPNYIYVNFKPNGIIVLPSSAGIKKHMIAIRGVTMTGPWDNEGSTSSSFFLTWGDNYVSWYNPNSAGMQLNQSGTEYQYMIYGEAN